MHHLPKMIATLVAALILLASQAEAGSRKSRPLKTGQTTCWSSAGTVIPCDGTGQDGDLRRGVGRAYRDNGDGTIRDLRTALMWEKLSDDGSIHDKDNVYTWAQAFERIADLNTPPCFAGFCDWRLPSLAEMETLRSLANVDPAISPAFSTGCTPGCTVLACSCAGSSYYWSSSTYAANPTDAWSVLFYDGDTYPNDKGNADYARAVRGGS